MLRPMSAALNPTLRLGQSGDVSAVHALLTAAGLPASDLRHARELTLWVVEIAGTVSGAIAMERFGVDGLLRSLVVKPSLRSQGIGQELVNCLERHAREQGIHRLVLLTETAEPFFRKIGYTRIDRTEASEAVRQSEEFRSLCPASAVCMAKAITNRDPG